MPVDFFRTLARVTLFHLRAHLDMEPEEEEEQIGGVRRQAALFRAPESGIDFDDHNLTGDDLVMAETDLRQLETWLHVNECDTIKRFLA